MQKKCSSLDKPIQVTNKPILHKSTIHLRKKKIDPKRLKQVKFMLMLGLIKLYSKQYLLRLEFNDLSSSSSQNTLFQLAYHSFHQLQEKLSMQINRLNSKETQNLPVLEDKNKTTKLNFIMTETSPNQFPKNTRQNMRNLTLKRQKSSHKFKYQTEIVFFEKLNVVIDSSNVKNLVKKSVEHFSILKNVIENVKILIYKYYREVKQNSQQSKQITNLKFYCNNICKIFKKLVYIISNIIDHDQNYSKFDKYYSKFGPKIQNPEQIDKCFQSLLFHVTCIIQLKRLFDICPRLQQIAQINPEAIQNIINSIIRLRHILGYLGKQIGHSPYVVNCKQQLSKSRGKFQEKDIWKKIYQKKYLSTKNKNQLKLE